MSDENTNKEVQVGLEPKIQMELSKDSYSTFEYNSRMVEVKNYLSLLDQGILTQEYMDEYFSGKPSAVLEAEYNLQFHMIELCTNLDVDSFSPDEMLAHYSLLKSIKDKIKNYSDFRYLLKQMVEERKEKIRLENSLPMVIRNITDKAMEFLNGLEDLDFTDEKISQLKGLIDYANESPILKESIDIFKKGKEKAE